MSLLLTVVVSAPVSAQTPNWNLYSGYTSLAPISFSGGPLNYVSGGQNLNQNASVFLTMTGNTPAPFVMDTGSTGIIVTPDHFTPGPTDTPLGPGSQFYSSSGLLSTGTYYLTDVVINNTATVAANGTNGAGATAGAALATARVAVLLVTNQTCTIPGRTCNPQMTAAGTPYGVAYMGVGFDRGSSSISPPAPYNNTNPFINIVSLPNNAPISTLRPGYLITNSGVTLGLSNTTDINNNNPASNFAFVKLTPNTLPSGQAAPAWQQAPMMISVGGVTGSGQILPDAGIPYSFLTPPSGYTLPTMTCPNPPGSGTCIAQVSNSQVQVFLPGQSTSQPASYSYTLYDPLLPPPGPLNPLNPDNTVAIITGGQPPPTTFLNTGRQFYSGFDYLYDPIGGYVGYAWTNAAGAIGQVTPGLSLVGNVNLQDGFSNSLPTFLMGVTTLLQTGTGSISSDISGSGSLTIGSGQVFLLGNNSYTGGTTVTGGAILAITADSGMGDGSGGLTLAGGTLQTFGAFTTTRAVTLGAGGGTVDTNNNSVTFSTAVSGPGSLTKNGLGLLTLSGANGYTGGTVVNGGTLMLAPGASLSPIGALVVNIGGIFDANDNNVTVGSLSGSGGTISMGNGNLIANDAGNTTLGASITGTGGLIMQGTGTLNLTGTNTYIGPTSVSNGRLAVNGSITSNVTVGSGGNLGGTGFITGTVLNNGIVAPGNSIGTLNVVGAFTQAAGSTYQVETNGAGQTDLINVTGAPGTATINGGTVTLTAATGVYAPSTTYTILSATGGVAGTYINANSLFPFLQPSLSYDANNVYLTLKPGGFARGAQTSNQMAVGRVLDQSVAGSSGDLATVIGTMATYTSSQGQAAMNAISGQNYSGFGTANLGSGLLFMNMMGQQMSAARGTGASRESRTALALACDVACDGDAPSPWSLWGSAMGGTGTIAGNANAGTLTYNAGGVATGVDYRFDTRFLAGIGVGFSTGNQWASGFSGQGTTNSYQASLYASFTQAAFYLDGLAGYGYNDNQMTRQIVLPNLAARLAQGRVGANQLLGQAEAGYRVSIYQPAAASITPFARFQATTNSQTGFSESGAGSLNLNVAPQTTGSARSVLGAELAGAFGAEGREKLALQMRLGWAHDYANTARPVTANFAGVPGANFTVFGAAPQRDAATLSLAANTAIAPGVSLYARYDGEMGTGTSSHALNGGLRVTW